MENTKSVLTDRQSRVLMLRSGLLDGKKYNYREIGIRPEFKVTPERIRQIEAKAMQRLWRAISLANPERRDIIIRFHMETKDLIQELESRRYMVLDPASRKAFYRHCEECLYCVPAYQQQKPEDCDSKTCKLHPFRPNFPLG